MLITKSNPRPQHTKQPRSELASMMKASSTSHRLTRASSIAADSTPKVRKRTDERHRALQPMSSIAGHRCPTSQHMQGQRDGAFSRPIYTYHQAVQSPLTLSRPSFSFRANHAMMLANQHENPSFGTTVQRNRMQPQEEWFGTTFNSNRNS